MSLPFIIDTCSSCFTSSPEDYDHGDHTFPISAVKYLPTSAVFMPNQLYLCMVPCSSYQLFHILMWFDIRVSIHILPLFTFFYSVVRRYEHCLHLLLLQPTSLLSESMHSNQVPRQHKQCIVHSHVWKFISNMFQGNNQLKDYEYLGRVTMKERERVLHAAACSPLLRKQARTGGTSKKSYCREVLHALFYFSRASVYFQKSCHSCQ